MKITLYDDEGKESRIFSTSNKKSLAEVVAEFDKKMIESLQISLRALLQDDKNNGKDIGRQKSPR